MSVLVAGFVVFATVMAQQITTHTALDRFRGTPEATDLVAFADESPFDAAALERLRALPGVAEAVGRVEAGAAIAGPSERWLELRSDPGRGPQARVRLVVHAPARGQEVLQRGRFSQALTHPHGDPAAGVPRAGHPAVLV